MTTMTPEKAYGDFRYAELMLELRRPIEAAALLGPIVEGAPDNAAALELLARALFGSAQLGRAERAFRALVELRPDDGWAHIGLARVLERQGKTDLAAVQRRIANALGEHD